MSVESALLGLTTKLASALLRKKLQVAKNERNARLSLVEILEGESDFSLTSVRRVRRESERIAETLSKRLQQRIRSEFPRMEEEEIEAAVLAVTELFDHQPVTDEQLFRVGLDPVILRAEFEIPWAKVALKTALNGQGVELGRALISEYLNLTTATVKGLPEFTNRALVEVLGREARLASLVDELIDRVPDYVPLPQGRSLSESQTEYRRALVRRLDTIELFGLPEDVKHRQYPLLDAYVGLSVQDFDQAALTERADTLDEAGQEQEQIIASFLDQLVDHERLLITGDAGSGKTTLLRWLAVNCAQNTLAAALRTNSSPMPFFIRLRDFADGVLPSADTLVTQTLSPMIAEILPKNRVRSVLSEGNAIMLIDGVDEVPAEVIPKVFEWLDDLVLLYPDIYYVVTSRPGAVAAAQVRATGFSRRQVRPMGWGQLLLMIRRWHEAAALAMESSEEADVVAASEFRLVERLQASLSLKAMAETPLLAAMLCALNVGDRDALPRRRVELYRDALLMMVTQRDRERGVFVEAGLLVEHADAIRLLQKVAFWLLINGQNDLSMQQLTSRVSETLSSLPGVRGSDVAVARHLSRRSGIFGEFAPGRFGFIHRTFLEFLAAGEILEQGSLGLLVERCVDPSWREAIVLAVGQSRRWEADQVVSAILDRADQEHDDRARRTAAMCLETASTLDESLTLRLVDILKERIPPTTLEDVTLLAIAGESGLELLPSVTVELPESVAAACVRVAAYVGGDAGLRYLSGLVSDQRPLVGRAIETAWGGFDVVAFARGVLAARVNNDDILRVDTPEKALAAYSSGLRCGIELTLGWVRSVPTSVSEIPYLRGLALTGIREPIRLELLTQMEALGTLSLNAVQLEQGYTAAAFESLRSLTIVGGSPNQWCDAIRARNLEAVRIHGAEWGSSKALILENPHLRHVSLSPFDGNDLTPFAGLSLESLELDSSGRLRTLSGGDCAQSVRDLSIVDAPSLDDVSMIKDFTVLSSASFAWCPSLEHLPIIPWLTRLELSDTQVTEIRSPELHTKLQKISLTDYKLRVPLDSFVSCPNVSTIDLTGSYADLSSKFPARELKHLTITGGRIPARSRRALELCGARFVGSEEA